MSDDVYRSRVFIVIFQIRMHYNIGVYVIWCDDITHYISYCYNDNKVNDWK